jgi:phage tail-like protein
MKRGFGLSVAVLLAVGVGISLRSEQSVRAQGAVGAFLWTLEVEGDELGAFSGVTGLSSESEVIEQRVTRSNGSGTVVKLPGVLRWSNVTLRRGVTNDGRLYDWRRMVEQGQAGFRKSVRITCYAQDQRPVARFTLHNAWPVKWVGPSLDARSNELPVETIELAHEGLERQ